MKPMLAATADMGKLKFPLMVSHKLDGIRALVYRGEVVSRSLKKIPNKHVQKLFGRPEYEGFDGELIVGDSCDKQVFQNTTSGVMSIEGTPDVFFHVFDCTLPNNTADYRFEHVSKRVFDGFHKRVLLVEQYIVKDQEDLRKLLKQFLDQGYEGAMGKRPNSKYKFGRSTTNEAALLKFKIFKDAEAVIVGFSRKMRNANLAVVNELGYLERSTKKDGKRATNMLGALHVKDLKTGVEFDIGSGFTDEQRKVIWRDQYDYFDRIVKYKYQEVGVKDKPRFPVFLGFRDSKDMS